MQGRGKFGFLLAACLSSAVEHFFGILDLLLILKIRRRNSSIIINLPLFYLSLGISFLFIFLSDVGERVVHFKAFFGIQSRHLQSMQLGIC